MSLEHLTTVLLSTWSVVVYLLSSLFATSNVIVPSKGCWNILAVPMYALAVAFGQQSETIVFRMNGASERSPLSTPLYLTNICRRRARERRVV